MEGDDRLLSDPLGSDEISGDSGIDTLDLSDRTADLLITIGTGGKNDGQAGENDSTRQATEIFLTGSGNDVIQDNWDDQNIFRTGAGNDLVYARRATDTSDGGDGTDTLSYSPAPFDSSSGAYFRVKIDVFAGAADSNEPTFVEMHHTFTNFERFVGGGQPDRLIGGARTGLPRRSAAGTTSSPAGSSGTRFSVAPATTSCAARRATTGSRARTGSTRSSGTRAPTP